jgi:hypothetical protein
MNDSPFFCFYQERDMVSAYQKKKNGPNWKLPNHAQFTTVGNIVYFLTPSYLLLRPIFGKCEGRLVVFDGGLGTISVLRGDDFGTFGLGTISGRVGSSTTSLKYPAPVPTSSAGRTEESPFEGQNMLQSKLTA